MGEIILTGGQTLREGDRARVLSGPYSGTEGRVVLIMDEPTSLGPYRMVWLDIPGHKVEGFRPDRLEKAGPAEERR